MASPHGLDDPAVRAHAWARYRRMLRWMAMGAAVVVALLIGVMRLTYGPLAWQTVVAAIGGFGGTMILGAALMGLMFLSSGTGHDEAVDRVDRDRR